MTETRHKGTAAAPGYCKGKVRVIKSLDLKSICMGKIPPEKTKKEIARVKRSMAQSIQELQALIKTRGKQLNLHIANIFEAHIMILQDPDYTQDIQKRIGTQHFNGEYAVSKVTLEWHDLFKNQPDVLFKERSVDILDVGRRILKNLRNPTEVSPSTGEIEKFILVGEEITPSDTLHLPKKNLLGIVSESGGATAHATILARALKIPYIYGVEKPLEVFRDNDFILLDGLNGEIFRQPIPETIQRYQNLFEEFQRIQNELAIELSEEECITLDGVSIKICANIGSLEEILLVDDFEEVGLYRTELEFLGLERKAPDEEELFTKYCEIFTKLFPKPITIRTFDFGSDKLPSFLNHYKENNPDLGLRALRLSLKEPELFTRQLRAIFRAAIEVPILLDLPENSPSHVKILLPMVTSIEEVRGVKKIIEEIRKQLEATYPRVPFLPLGAMIEVPAAALILDSLCQETDFINIGSNDLLQYFLAADRNNSRVSDIYNPFHPGVLRLLKHIFDGGQKGNREICLCGELAGDPGFASILLALGLKKFSMNPSAFLPIKQKIIKFGGKLTGIFQEKLLAATTSSEIKRAVDFFDEKNLSEPEYQFY